MTLWEFPLPKNKTWNTIEEKEESKKKKKKKRQKKKKEQHIYNCQKKKKATKLCIELQAYMDNFTNKLVIGCIYNSDTRAAWEQYLQNGSSIHKQTLLPAVENVCRKQ